jgi:hypothetical protein
MADWALCAAVEESVEVVVDDEEDGEEDEELVLLTFSWASAFSMALRKFELLLFTLRVPVSSLSESLPLAEMVL